MNRRPYVGEHHSGTGGRVLGESWLVIGKRVLQIMEIDKSGIREGEVPAGADDTPITDSQHRFMNRYAKSGIHVGSQPFGHRRGRIRRNAALKVPGRSGNFTNQSPALQTSPIFRPAFPP